MAVAGIPDARTLAPLLAALSIPVIVAAGALSAAPPSHQSPAAESVATRNAGASDEMGLPGCLIIAGRPIVHVGCIPCPPIWLGGPGMTCVEPPSALSASRRISLYPDGPSLFQEDMTAAGRPLLPAPAGRR